MPAEERGRGRDPAALAREAWFVEGLAALVRLGVPPVSAFDALADALAARSRDDVLGTAARDLREALAAARPIGPVLREHPAAFRPWVRLLLAAGEESERCDEDVLLDAAELLRSLAREGARRRTLWKKLSLLERAGVGDREKLECLLEEADDCGPELARALAAALQDVRRGRDLLEALAGREDAFDRLERAALRSPAASSAPLEVLAALQRLADRGEAEGSALSSIARAAQPVKQALKGVLSGIEDALGLTPRADPPAEGDPSRELPQIHVREIVRDRPEGAADETPGDPTPDRPGPAPAPARALSDAERRSLDEDFARIRSSLALLETSPAEEDVAREVAAEMRRLRALLAGAEGPTAERLADLELRFEKWKMDISG